MFRSALVGALLMALLIPGSALAAAPVALQAFEGAHAGRATPKPTPKLEPAKGGCTTVSTRGGKTFVDCAGSNVTGQPFSTGAVTLEERGETQLRSMVRQRASFRDQIVKDVLSE